MTTEAASYTGYAVVEFLGHVKRACHVSPETQYGTTLMRLDIPTPDGSTVTEYRHPNTLYALTPVTEEVARQAARFHQPQPVSPWELRQEEERPLLARRSQVSEDPYEQDYHDSRDDDDEDDDELLAELEESKPDPDIAFAAADTRKSPF